MVTSEVLLEYHLCRLVSVNLEWSPTCSGQVNNVTVSIATVEMGNKCMQSWSKHDADLCRLHWVAEDKQAEQEMQTS